MSHDPLPTSPPHDRGVGCLARLFWMMLGYLVLLFAGVAIAQAPRRWSLSEADLAYWGTLAGMIAARYGDIRYLGGRTSDGQQLATWADWKRYSLLLLAFGFVIWIVLHAVAGSAS